MTILSEYVTFLYKLPNKSDVAVYLLFSNHKTEISSLRMFLINECIYIYNISMIRIKQKTSTNVTDNEILVIQSSILKGHYIL